MGIAGAVFSFCVWFLGLVSIIGFQDNGGIEVGTFAVIVALLTIFYYVYARKRQTFSVQENRVLLVAHVMKFNTKRGAGGRKKPSRSGTNTNATDTSQHSMASPSQRTAKSQRLASRGISVKQASDRIVTTRGSVG
ncbi:hypothetical protein ATCC90586_004644 [Pythium insidiosum]|nr:hypothetical protein ATCC90586_004644 [Pythium insidiosum]